MSKCDDMYYFNRLFDIYGGLLTLKQAECFKLYNFEDYSLQEIADMLGVSRNAVHKNINVAKDSLNNFERVLCIVKKNIELEKIIIETKNKYHISDLEIERILIKLF